MKFVKRVFVVAASLAVLSGCNYASMRPAARSKMQFDQGLQKATVTGLFSSDHAVISDDEIDRILSTQVVVREGCRVGIVGYDSPNRSWARWSPELARMNDASIDFLKATLEATVRVREVAVLPALILPRDRTVAHLRQAAARMQADVLLIYSTGTQTYRSRRMWSKDRVKARCVVEALLLDVRSGLVTATATSATDYEAVKNREDYNFTETIHKAEAGAFGRAMQEIATKFVKALDA